MDRWGQGQGLVARGRGGARLKQSPAICGEALPDPLEGEGGFPRRRGDQTEEGEGKGQGSGSVRWPQLGPGTQQPPGPSAAAYSSASAEPCPFLFRSLGLRSFFAICPALTDLCCWP